MGKHYYHKGDETKIFSEDEVPEGWERGLSEAEKKKRDEKRRKTCIEKYGADAPAKSQKIKNKIAQTNYRRYGTKAPSQNEEIKKKAAQTNIERYGYYSSAMAPEVKEKQKQTNLQKYGTVSSAQNEDVKRKAAETCIERYGAVSPSMNAEVQEKKRQTTQKNFGVDYPMQSEEVMRKSRETNLQKYGFEYASQSPEVQEKVKQTSLERYGTESPSQSEEVWKKIEATWMEKYGVNNPSKSPEIQKKKEETWLKIYGDTSPFRSSIVQNKIKQTNLERHGVEWFCQHPDARKYSNDSKPNLYFASLLDRNSIKYEREFNIERYSFDFRVGNILIEINPSATHNSLWNPFERSKSNNGKSKDYHKNKSLVGEDNGYQVIHVWDWDNIDKVIGLLRTRETVYARKCKIETITGEERKKFINENHLQGDCRGQEICYGLYHNQNLVSIMTFGKPRYNKNYEYELLRYCSIKNITGGAEKLFKHFISDYNPSSVISYCDRSKFRGDVYVKLGFIIKSQGAPAKHWYSKKENRHITDNLLRQRGYDQIFHENYGKGTSNEELIIQRGYIPVYDCGQSVYVYNKET